MRIHFFSSLLLIGACGIGTSNIDDGDTEVTMEDSKADGVRGNWSVSSRRGQTQLGSSVLAADMDGDGKLDLVVGAAGADKVYIYLSTDDGLPAHADASIAGGELFGANLARLPKEGGDCYAATSTDEPYVSVYCGLSPTRRWASTGLVGVPSAYNDWNIATGDYNGDEKTDLVISESGDRGRVWAINGGGTTILRRSIAWQLDGERDFGRLGEGLVLDDFDQDGFADLAVSAPADNAGDSDGYVRLYRGSATGLASTPSWTRRGPTDDAHYGKALATSDVNGDGRPDLAITYESNYHGRVDVFHSAGSTFSPGPDDTLSEASSGNSLTDFAKSIAGGVDLDGDGYGDLLVGEPNHQLKGRVLAFLGSANGLRSEPAWTKSGAQANSAFGDSVTAADVDGDGKVDIIVGEPSFDAPSGGGTADYAGRVNTYTGARLSLH